ncbi:SMI1/KNR4 family protein [Spirillospora sp. NPDC048819]|uniref:SMI1/KNR4 family protein n=1 Tax=Spirillospora sp. NPDC048819 TaxID=3155268 RepID=UPI0033FA687C
MGNSALDTLLSLVPPPESRYIGERGWEAVFADVGTRLPNEYVELINHYGAGVWAGWLKFFPPGRSGRYGMPEKSARARDGYRTLRADFPEEFRLPVWPEPGGFLPVADTAHGDYLGWLTEGEDPESWPLIFWPRHNDQGPPLTCGFADVVYALLIGDHEKFGFPNGEDEDEDEDDLESRQPDFEAFTAARFDRHG